MPTQNPEGEAAAETEALTARLSAPTHQVLLLYYISSFVLLYYILCATNFCRQEIHDREKPKQAMQALHKEGSE